MEGEKEKTESRFDKELLDRIEEMKVGNSGIKTMSKRDYIVAGVIVVISLSLVIAGAFIH